MLRGVVVLIALATTVSEWSTGVSLVVVVPTLVVAIAGSTVLGLFADSYKESNEYISYVIYIIICNLRILSATAQVLWHASRLSKRLLVP